ncbi:unnamed protein product [Polarella glacialis]|uniref:Globin domain-containing protein n=1 Tax=Polarella glacialis TaxID=89957 RepID=A0A813EQH3_POLGL|nr:unnamed protein product [Polarella glacialis]
MSVVEVTEEVYEEEEEEMDAEVAEDASPDVEGGETLEDDAMALEANKVNAESFELLRFSKESVDEVKRCWFSFLDRCASKDAAGAAIYAAIFDSAPSLHSLFKTPRAVMAMRFMNGISSMINVLEDPVKLKTQVETLGFQHLDLEVTVPRVAIFRDAIVGLLEMELGEDMSSLGRNSLAAFLGYVGGSYIFIRVNYAERIKIIIKSWAIANKKTEEEVAVDGLVVEENEPAECEATLQDEGPGKTADLEKGHDNKLNNNAGMTVPTTFSEMFTFNSAVMGFGSDVWMEAVLDSFDSIVMNVANSYRLQEECDVLSIRLEKFNKHSIRLSAYKAVMLASLRSLVPKEWNSTYEVAWGWFWENVERMLQANLGRPAVMEIALTRFMNSLDDSTRDKVRRLIFVTFFQMAPAGQEMFKQSTTRLHFIADKVLEMTVDILRDPQRMCEDVSALGLRHVGYAPPTELFGPFVSSCIEVVRNLTQDEKLEDAFSWSLGLISRMLVRTILEGSTIVMKAININSSTQLKSAVDCAPRGKRAVWMLNITVGTQSISPLMWSIESGALDAAQGIIKDLLTVRADRDRYYYAAEELFTRHPDIVYRLCQEARSLVSHLLDGLIWRSRTTENGKRRVNYYIKHILVGEDGRLNDAMSWIADLGDPKLVRHPVLVLTSDIVWNGPAYFCFLTCKVWLVFTLVAFMTAQSILSMYGKNAHGFEVGNATREAQFALRLFVYLFCMGQLAIYHIRASAKAYKGKKVFKLCCLRVPEYLTAFQEWISLVQCIALIFMVSTCPKLYCMVHWHDQEDAFLGAGILSDWCPEAEEIRITYSILSVTTMLIFFLRMTDFAVMNNTLSAYLIMAFSCLKEVFLFIVALFCVIFAFSASTLALFQSTPHFKDIPTAALSYLEMSFALFDPNEYEKIHGTVLIFILVVLFQICIFVFLLNLLIAQLCSVHRSMYDDIVGHARMQRIVTIYATLPYVAVPLLTKWIGSLKLDQKLEFGLGDVGLAGGVQVLEPANLNPTILETIRRFGGSTSPSAPWPAEEEEASEGDPGLARMEKMMTRMMQTLEGKRGKKGSRSGSRSGSSGGSRLGGSLSSSEHSSKDEAANSD